jgi:hypothetical protein
MDVTDDSDRRRDVDDVALEHKHLLCLFAYLAQERLVQELFAQELLDTCVEVESHRVVAYLSAGVQSRG